MELITDKVEHFQKFYAWALTRTDDRVKDWFLMQSYTPTLAITALYLFAVWVGPKIMKDREPFKFKWTLFFYNFGLIVMNFHICSQLLWYSTKLNYSYSCQPVNYTNDHGEMKIASALWWFYFSKCVEMLDTIFFIMLRKKDNQVSFLHVYHHASMFPIWWIGIKWVAGGQSFFGAMINSFIHVVMYTYYGVSALGPEYQKYLWWKRYLTKLQLIQFVTGIVHAVQSLGKGCDFPEALHWALIFYAFTILLLFLNFYFHTYLKSRSAKTKGGESKAQVANGKVANGTTRGHKRNGSVVTANGVIEAKKDK
ncbi:elongation of very long chain fatty acids protein 4-like isoform X2 [Haliotis rubra]|uniref:elongation of very long chain fatty acids protein 4-like isoform X2 n=1 Tax=Haliotis rubra TaxID=36100 RepID=UPI001EE5DFC4|nr:elongation of very long chain fatty acids protein 4-like isoform X2 [Haliotis rubra]